MARKPYQKPLGPPHSMTDAELYMRGRGTSADAPRPTPAPMRSSFASERDRRLWEEQAETSRRIRELERAGHRHELASPQVRDEDLQGFMDGLKDPSSRARVAERRAAVGAANHRAAAGVSALEHCSVCGRPIYGTHEYPVRDKHGRFRHGRCE